MILGTLRRRRGNGLGATYYVQNLCALRAQYVARSICLPPPRSLRVRCTRRIRFRRDARWGRAGVTGTPRVATRPDRLPEAPPTALRRSTAPPDPALRCGENCWPAKVHHRLEDSREAISWFNVMLVSSVLDPSFSLRYGKQAKLSCKIICTRVFE